MRIRQNFIRWVALLLAMSAAGVAAAPSGVPVTYVFSGVANGSVGGTPFSGRAYNFTFAAETGTAQNAAYVFSNVFQQGTVTIDGTACAAGCSLDNPGLYAVFNAGPYNGFGHGFSLESGLYLPGSTFIDGCWDCDSTVVNDNLVTNVPPTPSGDQGVFAPYPAFATSGGAVQITALDGPITYSVTVQTVNVPALSRWGLALMTMLLAAGAALMIGARRS